MPSKVTIHEGTPQQGSVGVGDAVLLRVDGKPVRATVRHIELADDPKAKYAFSVQLEQTVEYSWQSYLCYIDRCKVLDTDIAIPE